MGKRNLEVVDAFSLLSSQLVRAARTAFGDYGVAIQSTPCDEAVPPFAGTQSHLDAATIGFTSRGFGGALVIVAASTTVKTWRPTDTGLGDGELHDTIAEFSNLVLGQMKRGLLVEGVELQMATPTSFCARNLAVPKASLPCSRWHTFTSPGGWIAVRLDTAFEGATITIEAAGEAPAAAGDMMLF